MEELAILVVKAQRGDLEAYGHMVRRFQDMAYGYAYSILGDFHLAEDAAQEAFIQAYRSLPDLREPSAFASWFRKVVFKHCDRILRVNKLPTVPLETALEVASTEPGPAEKAETREMKARVLDAIRALPENERVVTTLFYIDGYSHNDIAGFLEVPVSTVKSRLHTSRKQLKERMIEMLGDSLNEHALPDTFPCRVIANLQMPPFNSTLMGMFRGVLDYYGLDISDAMLYGGSGHAFLMNMHKDLCPSGPYCWNRKPFFDLMRNLGIETVDQGFFSGSSGKPERAKVEATLKQSLDSGVPCGLVNLEYQIITGYDETGFLTAQPWKQCNPDFPPPHLTFGTWEEMADRVHVNFFTFNKIEPAGRQKTIADSLGYAVDLYRNPSNHTGEPYGVGADAYAKWIAAVENGQGSTHGNWWNAQVWGECRARAADYFTEIAGCDPKVAAEARELAKRYKIIGESLLQTADKGMKNQPKIELLRHAAQAEADCISLLESLRTAHF